MSIEAMKQALELLESANVSTSLIWQREDCCKSLRQAIEQAKQAQPVAWRNAAIRIGEELSSVGPFGYYDMTAEQWLDWAMAQEPRGKTSLNTPPQRQWVGLTDEEQQELYDAWIKIGDGWGSFYALIEAKLKEKT